MLGSDERNKKAAIEALRAYPNGMQIGGGITCDNAQEFLNAGASHVIVTSFVFRDAKIDFERLEKLVSLIGKEKLVLDLSCRKNPNLSHDDDLYYVMTDRWQKFSSVPITLETIKTLEQYCDEFLVHAVDVEGKQCGVQIDLIHLLAELVTIPVTYAGGVNAIEELDRVKEVGQGRVHLSIGSALDIFGGNMPYKDVVKWHDHHNNKH